MAVYSGTASDFPVGSPLSQIQPLDAFVFAGPGNKPSANLTETLIPGRLPYQLSNRQGTIMDTVEFPTALIQTVKPALFDLQYIQEAERINSSLVELIMCHCQSLLRPQFHLV